VFSARYVLKISMYFTLISVSERLKLGLLLIYESGINIILKIIYGSTYIYQHFGSPEVFGMELFSVQGARPLVIFDLVSQ